MWRVRDNWEFIILAFHHVGSLEDQIQVVRLGCGHLSLLGLLQPCWEGGKEGDKQAVSPGD